MSQELCLPPVKLHCSMLAEDAIKAALKDYKVKKEAAAASNWYNRQKHQPATYILHITELFNIHIIHVLLNK